MKTVISGAAEQAAASRAAVDKVLEYPRWKQAGVYGDDIADFLNETRPTEWKFAHHTGNLFIIVYR